METLQHFKNKQMKKDLITFVTLILILLCCGMASAQDKPTPKPPVPVVPKPQYSPDPTKPITITITLSFAQANDYVLVNANGGPDRLKTTKDLTGEQLFGADGNSGILGNYKAAADIINTQTFKSYTEFIKKDQEKFTADTLAKFHTVKKN